MATDDLYTGIDQVAERLGRGIINPHIRELAGWLAFKTSSIAFEDRYHMEEIEGGHRYWKRTPTSTFESLRESDLSDAWKVLQSVANGTIPPNVEVRLRAVLKYLRPPAQGAPAEQAPAQPAAVPAPPLGSELPPISMTQEQVEREIAKYKAERAVRYAELRDGIRDDLPGARKAAKRMFGRNAVARAIRTKSKAMVSKSPVWQAIRSELELKKRNIDRPRRKGLDAAALAAARDEGDSTSAQVIANETRGLVTKHLPASESQDVVHKLEMGEMTDAQARELVDLCKQQRLDARSRRRDHGVTDS